MKIGIFIRLLIIAGLGIALFLTLGFSKVKSQTDVIIKRELAGDAGLPKTVKTFHDGLVTCYVYSDNFRGGISCLK